jgi:glycosyltransferase involved in cell wall biosynthesis
MVHFRRALPILRRIRERYGDRVEFKLIGDAGFHDEELGIHGIRWSAATEVDDLYEFDIGIMPLPDDEWSRGKCGLKGLQYMALEIPTVMSPVGVNTEIIDDGANGFLASSEDEWVEKVGRLIESPELRAKFGSAGRQTVVSRYSVESQKGRYLDYLSALAG